MEGAQSMTIFLSITCQYLNHSCRLSYVDLTSIFYGWKHIIIINNWKLFTIFALLNKGYRCVSNNCQWNHHPPVYFVWTFKLVIFWIPIVIILTLNCDTICTPLHSYIYRSRKQVVGGCYPIALCPGPTSYWHRHLKLYSYNIYIPVLCK